MGWSSFHMNEPVKEWFKNQWNYPDSDYEVIDSALVKRNTLYGAVRNKKDGEVFCAIFLVRWSRDYYNFSYKDMTEFAGPYVHDCPERIMKLLSPLNDENDPNGWARQWRERVNHYYEKKKLLKGDVVIKTKDPINFTSGNEYQYFKKVGRRMLGGEMINGEFRSHGYVHITNLVNNFEFEIV